MIQNNLFLPPDPTPSTNIAGCDKLVKLKVVSQTLLGKIIRNARFYCLFVRVYMGRTSPRVCALVQLLELEVSVLSFPLPFFGRLGGLVCLDVVPLGFLQVRQQLLLGQALKERGLVNLLRFSNLNIF